MAINLGYKDKITWETIQTLYYPQGLDKQIEINSIITNGQVEWAKAVGELFQYMGVNAPLDSTSHQEDKSNANA